MSHPTFENPSLRQALCEIRYRPISDAVSSRMLGKLVPLLSEEYPLSDVIDDSPFKINLGGQTITEGNMHRYKFSSDEHSYIITVKRDAFSFTLNPSQTTNYSKEEFYNRLCIEWNRISDALDIIKITRIGVRYINKLQIENVQQNSDFFSVDSLYFPKSGLTEGFNFMNRNEIQMNKTNRFIVIAGSNPLQNETGKREFLLDIDRIVEGEELANDTIKDKLVNLHKDIEDVFFGSITELYKDKMK